MAPGTLSGFLRRSARGCGPEVGSAPAAGRGYNGSVLFLGDNLLAWLVLALGGALAVGTAMALARPRDEAPEGELARPPLARSVVMIALGGVAALWALGSLVAG